MAFLASTENVTFSSFFEFQWKPSMDPLLISYETSQRITFVNFAILCTSVAAFGIVANIINIIVFVKQGFNDTINLSLFTLAMADMSSLIFLTWIGACFNPYLRRLNLNFEPIEVIYLTGGLPRHYFTRVAGWVTSLVAIERCFCVLKPMQVKLIFTKNRISVAILFIFLIAFSTMVPVYYTTRLDLKFDVGTNRSYIGLVFIENKHKIDRLTFALGVTVSLSAFIVVASCTFILGWNLVKQSRWRAKTAMYVEAPPKSGEPSRDDKMRTSGGRPVMSTRDKQAVRTVTFIAAMFVVCLFPNALNLTLMSIFPEFNKTGKYENLFNAVWSFAQMAEGICSSANIIVYYMTSTKYKETFDKLFKCRRGLKE